MKTDRRTQVTGLHVKITRAAGSVERALDRWAELPDGLSMPRFGVLETLLHKGALSQKELAAKVLKTKGNISVTVDSLFRDGLVSREEDGHDRRSVVVSLTDSGRSLIESYFPLHIDALMRIYRTLSDDEVIQLAALVKKLGLSIERSLG